MTELRKKQDKPNDPPYAGGEDEPASDRRQPQHQGNDFPVDESDQGPGAAAAVDGQQPEVPKVGSRDAPGG